MFRKIISFLKAYYFLLVIIWFAGLFILSVALNVYFVSYVTGGNEVAEVVDGDTFQLKSGKRVRLLGADAPEYDHCGGKEAKALLTSLIFGKKVELAEEVKEAYGRSLALVYADGRLVNEVMLMGGWGRTDYRKNSKRDMLTQAFTMAKEGKRGIFSLCREEAGEETTDMSDMITSGNEASSSCSIKGNIDASTYEKFYHIPGCLHYKEIVLEKDRGEQYFCTEEEASAAGFRKAAGCP